MIPDCELLRRYADARDEAAFAEVVRRHADLVYSAALRLTGGDTQLAQDVAQKVFTTMANKAAALSRHTSLAGWLHTTTRYAASVAVRGERRRQTREREAIAMEHNPTTTEADWMQLEPLLDEAVGQLRVSDREAVLLRYFQGKSHREVAMELGWSEAVARKRVERALDQLRTHFTRRGVTVSSIVLATAMTANSVQAAPAGLAANLTSVSLANAAKAGLAGTFLKGITMTLKTKIALTTIVVIGLSAIPAVLLSNAMAQDNDLNTGLAQENNSLQKQVNQLNQKLRDLNPARTPAQIQAMAHGYLPVSLDAIKNLHFSIADNFKLDSVAAGLLGMTPAEVTQVQNVLNELQSRVQAYEKANLRVMTPAEVQNNSLIMNFLTENPGTQSAYEIPPMSEEMRAEQLQWLSDSLAEALGPERGAVLLSKALNTSGGVNDQLWLRPNFYQAIVFSDTVDASGTPRSSWRSFSDTLDGPGFGGGSINDPQPYPEEWAGLMKDLRGNVHPPEPALSPQEAAVQSNLRQIAAAAAQYMLDNGIRTVTVQQLLRGTPSYLRLPTPVAGENYGNLVINQTDTSISVEVPNLGTVTLDL